MFLRSLVLSRHVPHLSVAVGWSSYIRLIPYPCCIPLSEPSWSSYVTLSAAHHTRSFVHPFSPSAPPAPPTQLCHSPLWNIRPILYMLPYSLRGLGFPVFLEWCIQHSGGHLQAHPHSHYFHRIRITNTIDTRILYPYSSHCIRLYGYTAIYDSRIDYDLVYALKSYRDASSESNYGGDARVYMHMLSWTR